MNLIIFWDRIDCLISSALAPLDEVFDDMSTLSFSFIVVTIVLIVISYKFVWVCTELARERIEWHRWRRGGGR